MNKEEIKHGTSLVMDSAAGEARRLVRRIWREGVTVHLF